MVLSASEVQRIRCPQAKMRTKPRSLQVHGLGHRQGRELIEQLDVSLLQDWVATLEWPDHAFAFH